MLSARRVLLPTLLALPFAACECPDPNLNALPAPSAVLVYGNQEAPPRERIDIAFGSQLVESTATDTFSVMNIGNGTLEVLDVRLTSHPDWCPNASSAFSIVDPLADEEGVRAFSLEGALREGDDFQFREVSVRFNPLDGSPGCAVVEVQTNQELEDNPTEHVTLYAVLTGQGDAPQLCTSTPVIDFGALYIGDTAEDTVVLESCGTRPIQITAMMTNAELPDPFGVTEPSFPTTLNPGETLEIPVSFAPLEERAWSMAAGNAGILTFASDAGLVYTIGLEGVGQRRPSCQIDAVPVALNFGSVAEGRTSQQSIVVRNLGDLDCAVDSIAVRDPGTSFTAVVVGGTPPLTLAPGDYVSVDVTFAPPVVAGTENNFIDVASDDPVSPLVSIPLEGNSIEATPCLMEATPTGMNFGNQAVGSTQDQSLQLTNVGTETCSVRSVTLLSGGESFSVTAGVFPLIGSPVQPGSSMTVLVAFRPETEGLKVGTVRAEYKEFPGFGQPELNLDIPVSGNGLSPALCVSPQHLDFGALNVGQAADQNFNVANCGAVDVEIRGIQLRAATHPDYSLPTLPALPEYLPPGGSFQVTVRSSPSVQGTALGGTAMYGAVEVLSDDTDDPAIPVTLTTNAQPCVDGLYCIPAELDFGEVDLTSSLIRAVTCSNPGSSPVVLNPSVTGPFEVVYGPNIIQPGEVANLTLRYEPITDGEHTGVLTMGANSCDGGPLTIPLRGSGVDNHLPICPTPDTFTPEVVWHWEGGSTETGSKQVWVTPLITRLEDTDGDGRLTRDDTVRVVFISFNHADSPSLTDTDHFNDPTPGILRAVDGPTGAEVWTVSDPDYRLNSSVTPVVADIDADGFVEIVAQAWVVLEGVEDIEGGPKVKGKFARGYLLAFEHDGTFKWKSEEWTRSSDEIEDAGGLAVADIDGDGFGEIAIGDHVYDHNGNLMWRGGLGTGSTGHGPMSVFAQVDDDPQLELVTGSTVYNHDGSVLWHNEGSLLSYTDGQVSVADLDGDGDNEIVVRNGQLRVLDGATGATLAGPMTPPTDMAMGYECQPSSDPDSEDDCNIIPTNTAIVDVDDDGFLEIAVSAQGVILTYDRNLNELWRAQIWDGTGASGPVGFDFEADGNVNVVYSDEGNVWVYDPNGSSIYGAERGSVTMMETVAIGDINMDKHANMVVGSNEPQFGLSKGLDMLTNAGTSWAHARSMWNQHAYIESQIGELGTLVYDPNNTALKGFRTASAQCEQP